MGATDYTVAEPEGSGKNAGLVAAHCAPDKAEADDQHGPCGGLRNAACVYIGAEAAICTTDDLRAVPEEYDIVSVRVLYPIFIFIIWCRGAVYP